MRYILLIHGMLAIWISIDGYKRKLNLIPWAVATILLGPITLPYYISIRPLKASQSNQRKFNFIFMSDMHVGEGSDKNRTFFLETIEDIRKLNREDGLDFVASGGDMCYRTMDAYNDSISRLKLDGMPVFNTAEQAGPGSLYEEIYLRLYEITGYST